MFLGSGSGFLIGPADERWDVVMLVRQKDLQTFVAFASNEAILAALVHRRAAVEDSRLLPLVEHASQNALDPPGYVHSADQVIQER